MNLPRHTLILLPLLLVACAHTPGGKGNAENAPTGPARVVEVEPVLPALALDERMLYEFLLGDIALQRGRPELAGQAYRDLAKMTRDPRVARRAAQITFESRQMDKALESFRLWQELEPSAPLPKQMLVSLLLSGGKLDEARPHAERLLAEDVKNTGRVFLQFHPFLMRLPNKSAGLDWAAGVAGPYPNVAEAHWLVAQLAAQAGNKELALGEAQQAAQLRPEWDAAVMFEAQLLLPKEPGKAFERLRKVLDARPASKELRLFYARALLEQKHYAESRGQFQQLLTANPDNTELAFAVALLSLQMGELERAERELQETLRRGKKDAGTVHYYLAQLNEAKKDEAAALAQYRQVQDGEYVYASRLRETYLLDKAGRQEEARAALKRAPVVNNQQRVTVVLIEAQMLRDAKQFEAAYQLLTDSLEKLPNHPQLLFEAAMTADKLGKPEVFEQMLRKVLRVAPDHAHAYNALGYSLLERNVRVDEGMRLVEKAYELEPGDAAITDSMGWGYYRLGQLDKSAEFLRRAFSVSQDPEIAMHLGEVLWMQGSKDEARKIWDDALRAHPDNESLRQLIKRFTP